jgi:hypothetical protein
VGQSATMEIDLGERETVDARWGRDSEAEARFVRDLDVEHRDLEVRAGFCWVNLIFFLLKITIP